MSYGKRLCLCSVLVLALVACGQREPQDIGARLTSPHVRVLAAPIRDYQEARWSPDGQMIAAIGWRRASATQVVQSVLLLRPDGTLIREITTFPGAVDGVDLKTLAWRSDGMLAVVADLSSVQDLRTDPRPDRDALYLIDPRDSQRPLQILRMNL